MKIEKTGRRQFLQRASGSLIAAGTVSGSAFAAAQAATERKTMDQATQQAMTPQQALQRLKEGNARFVQGERLNRDYRQQVELTSSGQYPFAAVLACLDSRSASELIFDQGFGDIFSARVAGNYVDEEILGGLEFACVVSGAKFILVVGHTDCGAVKGAVDDVKLGNLTSTLSNLKPAVSAVNGFDHDRSSGNDDFVHAVAEQNVTLALEKIRNGSPLLRERLDKGELGLAGAMYSLNTGVVTFM